MPKVSVIIPAYNAEMYIGQAFDSLINQTYNDWECIVVNDASTDRTLSVIEEYANRDPRIKFKTLAKNTGSAKAPRDTAVTMACSEWILALDSDDKLAADTIEKLMARQLETNADMVLLKLVLTDKDGNTKYSSIPAADFDFSQIMTGLKAAKLTIGEWVIPGNGLIKKKLWDSRHPIDNFMNADEYDTRQMMIATEKVAFVDAVYYYRQIPSSITRAFSIKLFDTLYINKLLYELFKQTHDTEDKTVQLMKIVQWHDIIHKRLLLLRNLNKFSNDERRSLNVLIEESYKTIENRMTMHKSFVKNILLGSSYSLFKLTTYFASKLRKA